MTIRQLWVRTEVILRDSDSPLVRAIRADEAERAEQEQVDLIDDALAPFMNGA